jgi:hypothetical protein
MFNKLRNAVGESAIRAAIDSYSPRINEKLAQITSLPVAQVKDDARYHSAVIAPALAAVLASSSGATKMIPNFEQRFKRALLHVRDQLVIVDEANDKVSLVPDYRARVSDVLIEGFKQSA